MSPDTPPLNHVDVLLITVTKVEALAVLNWVDQKFGRRPETRYVDLQTYYDLGVVGGASTLMLQSEMGAGGPSGSIVTTLDAIGAVNPSAIIMVGIAFGMDEQKQHIGDILVSKQLLGYELQRVGTGANADTVIRPRGDRPAASPRLLDRFRSGELLWAGAKVEFGLMLSGDKLVDNVDFRNQLRQIEPEAIGGEMEGAGLYAAAHRRNVDWIVVKAICDWADGRKHENKSGRQQLAAQNAAGFALHVIERGGLARPRPEATPTPSANPGWNTAAIRELLTAAFNDEELTTLCFDRFNSVYHSFSTGMSKGQKIQLLLDHCIRHEQLAQLLENVKTHNPAQYTRFASRLQA